MTPPRDGSARAARDGIASGVAAAAPSIATLAARGRVEAGSAVAPTNATGRWAWGGEAAREDRPSLGHAALGFRIHRAASLPADP